jgi:hypothetical protein
MITIVDWPKALRACVCVCVCVCVLSTVSTYRCTVLSPSLLFYHHLFRDMRVCVYLLNNAYRVHVCVCVCVCVCVIKLEVRQEREIEHCLLIHLSTIHSVCILYSCDYCLHSHPAAISLNPLFIHSSFYSSCIHRAPSLRIEVCVVKLEVR